MRIGILGGSFNPPHVGHLALAQAALASGMVERVCLIPAAIPPHKAAPSQADPETRLAMTRLLAESDSRLMVDGLELERSGPSFTIDTVRQLTAGSPGSAYRVIIGSDLAKTFATWRDYRQLLRLSPPMIAERPGDLLGGRDDFVGMSDAEKDIMCRGRFAMEPVDMSSTMVRALLAGGAGDDELVCCLTPAVLRYIRRHNLYLSPN